MRKTVLTALIGIVFLSCEEEPITEIAPISNDEYYIRYEVQTVTRYLGATVDVTVRMEDGTLVTFEVPQRIEWEMIVGPVKKDFLTYIKADNSSLSSGKTEIYASIYISKNGSPFAIKAVDGSKVQRESATLTYTIDY